MLTTSVVSIDKTETILVRGRPEAIPQLVPAGSAEADPLGRKREEVAHRDPAVYQTKKLPKASVLTVEHRLCALA